MAFTIKLTTTKTVTLRLPRWLTQDVLVRHLTIVLSIGIVVVTAWVLSVSIVLPLTTPASLKPEEITAQKAQIDQETLNTVLMKNEEKQDNSSFDSTRDPFTN